MNIQLRYLNPAGNITAVVLSPVQPALRPALSRAIMAEGRAEQVGFAVPPQLGGICRLEMMGGEFCGNAVRSYGGLWAVEHGLGKVTIPVEISGAVKPVPVMVEPDGIQSYADMPLPLGMNWITVEDRRYPLILCQGICHLLALEQNPLPAFLEAARPQLDALGQEAWGVMFLKEQRLVPAVYVKSTDSLVWESSCGSGSVAAAWYLAGANPARQSFHFQEPGGELHVSVRWKDGMMSECFMGGVVGIGSVEEFCWTGE